MADNKANYEINLVDKYSKKIDQIDKKTSDFDSRVLGLGKTKTGVFAGGAILAGMGRLIGTTSKLAGNMEQTEIAFETFLGSKGAMRQVIGDLNEFANRTSYTNDQIIATGRSLLAANVPADQLTDTLQMIGDVAAGANVPITDLGDIYAKVMNKGKLQAEELNQLAERGIPIIDQLSKEFGVTKQEVFELGSKGKITSDVMVKAFKSMTGEGGKFFKLMEKQSQSAVGLMSTLEGKTELLGIAIGKQLLPAQKYLTRQTISLVDKLNEWVEVPTSERIEEERRELNSLVTYLNGANVSEEEREKILKRIKEIAPDVNDLIKKEGDQIIVNTDALREFNEQQINKIILQKQEEKIGKLVAKRNEVAVEKREAELELSRKLADFQDRVNKSQKLNTVDRKIFNDILSSNLSLSEKSNQIEQERGRILRLKTPLEISALGLGKSTYKYNVKLLSVTDKLNDLDADRNDLLAERDKLAKELGLNFGQKPASVITGKIEGAEDVTAGITKITAAAPKVFNINIGNLVENFEISTTNLTEGAGEVRDLVTRALLEGLADVQPLVR